MYSKFDQVDIIKIQENVGAFGCLEIGMFLVTCYRELLIVFVNFNFFHFS